jgi:hypothetical protein
MTEIPEDIPRMLLAPSHKFELNGEIVEVDARPVPVYGVAKWPSCPGCNAEGSKEGYLLTPDEWPNAVVICGEDGCGIWWGLIPQPPAEHHIFRDIDEEGRS